MADGTVRPSDAAAFAALAGFESAVKARAEVSTSLGCHTRNRKKSGGHSGSRKRARPRKAAAFPSPVVHEGYAVAIPVVVDGEFTGYVGSLELNKNLEIKKSKNKFPTMDLELVTTRLLDRDLRLHKLSVNSDILPDGAEVMFFVHGKFTHRIGATYEFQDAKLQNFPLVTTNRQNQQKESFAPLLMLKKETLFLTCLMDATPETSNF